MHQQQNQHHLSTSSPTSTSVPEPSATAGPTSEPIAPPTAEPTSSPTDDPGSSPTVAPTAVPSFVPTATPETEPTNPPASSESPNPSSSPSGIYYQEVPVINGLNVTAEIVNKTDDNGVMFIVCSYNDAGDVLTDAAVEIIPKSDIPKRVSIDLKKGGNIKTFLWSSEMVPAGLTKVSRSNDNRIVCFMWPGIENFNNQDIEVNYSEKSRIL